MTDGGVQLGGSVLPVGRDTLDGAGPNVTLGVRPEDVVLTEDGSGLPITVEVVEELGADSYIYGVAEGGDVNQPIIARVDGRRPPEKGSKVFLTAQADHVHLFHGETGERLGATHAVV